MSATASIKTEQGAPGTAKESFSDALRGTGVSPELAPYVNLDTAPLVTLAVQRNEVRLTADGAVAAITGEHTGRSANDKYIVNDPELSADVWWHDGNKPMAPEAFDDFAQVAREYLNGQQLFVEDLYAGASEEHRLRVRVVTTNAWHALFARTMFIRPPLPVPDDFEPDFVILHAPDLDAPKEALGLRTTTAIATSFKKKLIVIAGTKYAGEVKKSIFTAMNWLLPAAGVFPMHCSANIGKEGDVALFFGLSGTGKTTLSSDPERALIGDDEHGWGPEGVFNVEGGCYAKVIGLRQEAEPEIWQASHRFGTVLENVVLDESGRVDFDDDSLTENTRACYPLEALLNRHESGQGGAPKNVIMLTADAFGVLPPVSRLTGEEAMRQFLSGYTARIAGTEKGVKEPQATFSACFGAPFLPRRPEVYAQMLKDYLARSGAKCWLVNTGWIAGPYGTGRRMSLTQTRAILKAILTDTIGAEGWWTDAQFGLECPVAVPGVPAEVLNPRATWADGAAYDAQAEVLKSKFAENFRQYADLSF